MNNLLPLTVNAGAGEHLCLSEELSDVIITVKSSSGNWRFPAHKLILFTQSPVFQTMFKNDFTEKIHNEIPITDIEPHIVELLLRYMYCGVAVLENWQEAIDLLQAAHKYSVDALVQYCSRFLESVITINNVCYIYNEACMYSLITLKEKCLRLILDAGFILLTTKAFERLGKEAVVEIIDNRELNIDNELMVFQALLKWAPLQCCRSNMPMTDENILKELTPFLKYVCFDDMSDTEKSSLPAAVLSCVKPNNRNRVTYHVNDSLLNYAHYFNFKTDHETVACVGDQFNCLRFSIDKSIYLIALRFMILIPQIPEHFSLIFVKESASASYNPLTSNMARATWREEIEVSEGKRWETQVLMRTPYLLEEKSVYKFYIDTEIPNAFCPKLILLNQAIVTDKGLVNISLHCEHVYGITNLILI